MHDWVQQDYQEVKHGLMVHLQQRQSAKKSEIESVKQKSSDKTNEPLDSVLESGEKFRIDYEEDKMYSSLDLFLMQPDSWMNLDILGFQGKDHTKEFLEEFVNELRKARGEKFSTRLPLIAELSAVFADFT
ncbi:hypothetical protein QQZ08_004489 [Neonectria magnoliae]|uniref:Uncharacterized protein n=1 Tax=Neonectria magnoliae TaxID=2732573 RepID=A0ABR1I7S2_9HYPO